MYQKEYNRMNEQIVPDRELKAAVLEKAVPRRKGTFRPLVAIAAMLVLIFLVTPVMAECIPWILEHIAPELVEELDPVQRSDTDNGITMEVVAASVRGHVAELVVRIEGEALAEPVGVAPTLWANKEWLKSASIRSILDYEGAEDDKAKGIYYYQVVMQYQKGTTLEQILDGEMTVTLSNIRISGFASDEVEVPVILTDSEQVTLASVSSLKDYGFSSFGWADSEEYPHGCELGSFVMKPPAETVYDVTDKLGLTAAAYIDGKLHIQMRAVDMNGKAEWGYRGPYLVDAQGNQAVCLYRNLFARDGVQRIAYEEYIYDIPPEELENYTMVVQLEYSGMIPTNCEVTFRFSEDDVVKE